MLALTLSVFILGAAPEPICMDADLVYGKLKDGERATTKVDRDATVLCMYKGPDGPYFSFPVQLRKSLEQIVSPPLKGQTGTDEDQTLSVITPEGKRYALRIKPGGAMGCMYDKPARAYFCAMAVPDDPDAGTPKKPRGKTY
jgi:hypothetical protein